MSKIVTKTANGIRVDKSPETIDRENKMKSTNQLDRIEAKLDELLEVMKLQ